MRKLGFYAARSTVDDSVVHGQLIHSDDNKHAKLINVSTDLQVLRSFEVDIKTVRENVIFREDSNHVFNGDIVELFDWGTHSGKSLGFGVVTFNRQQCQYDIDMLDVDFTGRPDGIEDRYDLFRTNPQPTGYNAYDKELPLKFSDAFSYVDRENFSKR